METLICSSAAAALFLTSSGAAADIVLFDIGDDPQGWTDALIAAEFVEFDGWDFDDDQDYGVVGFHSAISCAGAGPVSEGLVPCEVSIETREGERNDYKQNAIGPSAGFGNVSNAIVAGYFTDAMRIVFSDVPISAFEFTTMAILGSDEITVSVRTESGNRFVFVGLPSPPEGRHYGLIATDGEVISEVEIWDPEGGAEGIQGAATIFTHAPAADLIDFDVITGERWSGSIVDLLESDDLYMRIQSGIGSRLSEAHLMEVVFQAESVVPSPDKISLRVESRIDETTGVARLRLRNWITNEFDQIERAPIGRDEAIIETGEVDASNYVRPSGAIEVSIKHTVFVPFLAFDFLTWFDLVQINLR